MKKTLSLLLAASAVLFTNCKQNELQSNLTGGRVLKISTSSDDALLKIDGSRVVEVRSPAPHLLWIIIYRSNGEVLSVFFRDNKDQPDEMVRYISGRDGTSLVSYEPDGSVREQKLVPYQAKEAKTKSP